MKNLSKNSGFVFSLLVASSFIQSCGKSDAMKDYKSIPLEQVHKNDASNQKIMTDFMTISLVTPDDKISVPTFLEGQANEAKLKLDILDDSVTGEIVFDGDAPAGSVLKASPTEPKVYIFSWTPKTGFIGSAPVQTVTVNFIGHVLTGPSYMANVVTRLSLPINVEHTQAKPKIVSVDLPQVINEGVDQTVQIRVQDTALSQVNQPDVEITHYQGTRNDENHKFDWGGNLTPNQPLVSGPDKNGVFTFSYTMKMKGQTLPLPPVEGSTKKADTNASIVNLCFTEVVRSKISNVVVTQDECTRVQFVNQPPVAYVEGDPDGVIGASTAVAGEQLTMFFEVKTPNGRGDIQPPKGSFAKFPSDSKNQDAKPKIVEVDKTSKAPVAANGPASADRFYKMTWIPSCSTTGSYNLNVYLENSLGGSKKHAELSRKINISSKSRSCDAPAAKKPAQQTQPAKK